jgi:metallo-beta-lactamase family protein
LPDSGFLQEEEARHANRHEYGRHRPSLPLYTREEAELCLKALSSVDFYSDFEPVPGMKVTFRRA